MRHDILADVFATIKNAESVGKKECVVPASKLVKGVLEVIHKHNYIGGFDYINDGKGGKFKIKLVGRINSCNVIRPRFSVKIKELIRWEKKYLPAYNVGVLILTTSKGIMDQKEAKKNNTGGKLLGYIY